MPPDSIPEPWNSFFKEIEVSLRQRLDLHCLGGFVMTILYGLDRPTADVDVLPVGLHPAMDPVLALAGQESPLHRKYQIYLEVVGVASIPMNYEDRLREM